MWKSSRWYTRAVWTRLAMGVVGTCTDTRVRGTALTSEHSHRRAKVAESACKSEWIVSEAFLLEFLLWRQWNTQKDIWLLPNECQRVYRPEGMRAVRMHDVFTPEHTHKDVSQTNFSKLISVNQRAVIPGLLATGWLYQFKGNGGRGGGPFAFKAFNSSCMHLYF